MPKLGRLPKLTAALAFAAFGCSGQIDKGPSGAGPNMSPAGGAPGTGGSGPNVGGAGPGTGGSGGVGQPATGDAGYGVFHRLSHAEYNNTVRDLLGDSSAPASSFPGDQESSKSGFVAGGAVANTDAADLFDAAEALSAKAMTHLTDFLPCKMMPTAAADQDQCAMMFISQFGKRAFRRPLTQDETTGFANYYSGLRSGSTDFQNSIRLVISAMLLSPQFLYRWETDPKSVVRDGNLIRYNGYEMASRLSYLFWASMPDDTGFANAEANKLSTPDQIEAEARRLLKDPKAQGAMSDFFGQWLGVTAIHSVPKDPKAFPDFTTALADSMGAETAAFASNTMLTGDAKLATIFSSSKSYIDANLAKLYGVSGVTSTTPVPTDLDPTQRSGILTQASFLAQQANADETNPVRRGKLIADRVLCTSLPPPPDNVPNPKPPAPNLSVRERFAEHSTNPCATACHSVLDPMGFAFENYNGIGAYQTMDGGKPVDATGTFKIDGVTKSIKNAIELGGILGASQQVGDCMARQMMRYALKRQEGAGEAASLTAAEAAMTKSGGDLREMLVALTKTRAFTHRTLSIGEVLP